MARVTIQSMPRRKARGGTRGNDEEIQSLAERIEDHLNRVAAESRAIRTILETFLRRFLESTPRPHRAFAMLKADTLAVLQAEADAAVDVPDDHRAAAAALFRAEAIFAELEAMLPPKDDAEPQTRN
jgi:hypothetical protein